MSVSTARCSLRKTMRLALACWRIFHSPSPKSLRPVESMARCNGPFCGPVLRPGHHALYRLSDLPAAIGADRDGNIAPETSARFRCNGSSRVGRPMTTICAWGHYGNRPAVRMAEPDSKD